MPERQSLGDKEGVPLGTPSFFMFGFLDAVNDVGGKVDRKIIYVYTVQVCS